MKKLLTIFITILTILSISCKKDNNDEVTNISNLFGNYKGEMRFETYDSTNTLIDSGIEDNRTFTLKISESDRTGMNLKLSYVWDSITIPYDMGGGTIGYDFFPEETLIIYANNLAGFSGSDYYFDIPSQPGDDDFPIIGLKKYTVDSKQYAARYLSNGRELKINTKMTNPYPDQHGKYYLIYETYTKQ